MSWKRSYCVVSGNGTTRARLGRLSTPHGEVETPQFMPVGTQASVKAMFPRDLEDVGARIVLGNTYHLSLRPGAPLIREMGGIHRFMGWTGPILTDSGGFQVFSLSKLRRVTDEGVHFRSHLDGTPVFLGPREAMTIQDDLGSDIAMVLDECPSHDADEREATLAVERSVRWAAMCRQFALERGFPGDGRMVFGIVQGGRFAGLRRQCAEELLELDFPGYAIGGVSVGESESEMLEQVDLTASLLPADRPRYVMGVGTPPQLLRMIAMGADLFDCVMPTRAARHGTAYTPHGRMNLKNERWKRDARPLVEGMDNYTCRSFSRSYLRHLVSTGESLGGMLLSLHNLHFYLDLMAQVRRHLAIGDFNEWHRAWIECYDGGDNET